MNQIELKKQVGERAAQYVEDGMIVGLGTGSTAEFFVAALGERVKNEGLQIIGVPTSDRTRNQAEALGITIKNIDDVAYIDVTVDGADEVDENFQGIKGGGAAHLWEKIVSSNSKRNIWIVDSSKMVKTLGAFPLPIEVIPFGSKHVVDKLVAAGYEPKIRREADGTPKLTHFHNYIIDLKVGSIPDPKKLGDELIHMVGVVEHGLFLDHVNTLIIGRPEGPQIIDNIR
ncbi:ribose-5-phosphate isomerase RpiA [Periweissella fabaria]|uniref:Ribose-5-phosphate isomerase A n=1 Tax=Periweissella fabaria TaxID=546157 RepID=A0ABN8BI10_9LACO|nr:ribose-5-phosphate isomerase RpiA [Periweissella fabaria]MCM0597999.1 ribose-5-phosphate isomerase RpiA [Periweissella fabaria]CAH0417400.1 Ribose-5-phosphate isomerase A [Periweissella fabaria]